MKRANALSKCPSCNAVANLRWPECLSCGEVLPSLKRLAYEVLERNGSRVSRAPPDPPAPFSNRWDNEMQELTAWFMGADRPLIRFELRANVTVLDPQQYWAGLKAIIARPSKAKVPTKHLRTELRRLHDLFGPAASRETS